MTLSADRQPCDCNCSSCGVCSLSPTLTTDSCSQGVCIPPPSPPPLSPSLSLSLSSQPLPLPTTSQIVLFTAAYACLPLPLTLCPVCTSEHPFTVFPPLLSLSLWVAKDQLCQGLFFVLGHRGDVAPSSSSKRGRGRCVSVYVCASIWCPAS